jgi:creatinine amidohydrolase
MVLEDITMAEFKKHLKKTKTIIIPFGTVEEHGNHLPLNTDTLIIYEVLKEVVKKEKGFSCAPSLLWCLYNYERASGYDRHHS